MQEELNTFLSQVIPKLRQAVEVEGHYLSVINFPLGENIEVCLFSSWQLYVEIILDDLFLYVTDNLKILQWQKSFCVLISN